MILGQWLAEHTAEDILKARKRSTEVYFVKEEDTISTCLGIFEHYEINHLLIEGTENGFCSIGPMLKWLTLEDVVKVILEEGPNKLCCSLPLIPCISLPKSITIKELISRWERSNNVDHDEERPSRRPAPFLLTDPDGGMLGVITVSDLLHYLFLYSCQLGPLVDEPIFGLCWDRVPLIYHGELAEIFLAQLLDHHSLGVVGIIDRKGSLLGSITLPDLLPLDQEALTLPLRQYLAINNHNILTLGGMMATCAEKLTFGEVLGKMLQQKSHHVWRLDDAGRPLGVIYLHHMINFIVARIRASSARLSVSI